jgi:bifunctional DNA-binding transcriptional regulator/antitoxin component of YhaV-PrlF toxin-antitoxin module
MLVSKMVKVILNSGNLYVRIPKEVKIVSGIEKGNEVIIQYNKESEQIIIKKI